MPKPYATAIIPTLNRSTTLPISIESIQKQTIQDIEIIIVLDGATEACRDIAFAAATKDFRIRVLDLPKALGSGERNVETAVLAARSDRVFYNDDDDIWLRHHVETLGPLLDKADIVDSRVATANREYELHLGICPGSNPNMKELLATYRHKNLFDTHIAHKKEAYKKYAQWVPDEGEGKRPVWEFFKGFSENKSCIWRSSGQVTSISLHGANRRDMTSQERAVEIQRWWSLVQNRDTLSKMIAEAGKIHHLFRLLSDMDEEDRNLETLSKDFEAYSDVVFSPVTEALCQLFSGKAISSTHAREILSHMCVATFVGYQTYPCVNRMLQVFDLEKTQHLVRELLEIRGPHRTGALFAQAIIYQKEKNTDLALKSIQMACYNGPDPVRQLARFKATVESAIK